MTVHDFQESLEKSKAQEDAPWWEPVYRKAFPGFVSSMSVRSDGWAQRGGIDRVVNLASGKTVFIDEKVRYRKNTGDILLEQWSRYEPPRTPGWMQKDLACDFIAYAFVPDEMCYVLPFLQLRRAWLESGSEWIVSAREQRNGFRFIDAQNKGYTTRSIAVPIPELLAALHSAQVVDWGEAA